MRLLLIALAGCAVGLLLAWSLSGPPDSLGAVTRGAERAAAPPTEAAARLRDGDSEEGARAVVDPSEAIRDSARLRGRVEDAAGAAVAGATVRAAPHDLRARPARVATTTTGTDGLFTLAGPPGSARIEIHAENLAPKVATARFEQQPASVPVSFVLDRAHRLHGRVVASDGAPLEGARVALLDGQPAIETRAVRCDAAGRFVLDAAALDTSWLLATAPGHAPRVERVQNAGPAELELRLEPGAPAELELQVEGGRAAWASIELLVDGAPLRLADGLGGRRPDAQGRAVLEDLPAGAYRLRVIPDDPLRAEGETEVALLGGHRTRTTVRLPGLVALHGRLVDDATGRPLRGVALEARGPWRSQRWSSVTDVAGAFGFVELPEGSPLELHVVQDDLELVASSTRSGVRVVPAQGEPPLELRARAARAVRGRVLDARGAAVSDVVVRLHWGVPRDDTLVARARSADGSFRFKLPDDAAGPYVVAAESHDAAGQVELDGARGALDLVLGLRPLGRVHGRVVGPDARGDAGRVVDLLPLDRSGRAALGWGGLEGHVDEEGGFALERVPAGSYRLALRGARGDGRRVDLPPGADLGPLDLAASPDAPPAVRGRVVDASGRPAAGVQVSAIPEVAAGEPDRAATASTDADGAFTLRPLAQGGHRLAAVRPGGLGSPAARTRRALTCRPGDEGLELVLEEPALGTLTGRLELDPPATARLFVTDGESGVLRRLEAGEFRAEGVPAGSLRVRVDAGGHRTLELEARVPAGGVADLGTLAPRALEAVTVHVADEAGAPWPGVEVYASSPSDPRQVPPRGDRSAGRTDADGRLVARVLGDEPLRLVAWTPGCAPGEALVDLAAAGSALRITLRRGVDLRLEGLRAATVGPLSWRLAVERLDGERVREHLLNNQVEWLVLRDLEPGAYRLDLRPAFEEGGGALARALELSLASGGDRVVRVDREAHPTSAPGGPR